jgi:PTS system sucrose-specific IIC component
LFKVKATALGAAGIPGIISIRPDTIISYIIGMAIAFTVAFIVTLVLAKRDEKKAVKQISDQAAA